MQTKVGVKLHMRNGGVVECCYTSKLRSYVGMLKEMYNTQNVTAFIRKNSTKNGVLYVMMREVVAVEIYEI